MAAFAHGKPIEKLKTTPVFKLQDKIGKNHVVLDLKKDIGFVPEKLVFERVLGLKNCFVIHGIVVGKEEDIASK